LTAFFQCDVAYLNAVRMTSNLFDKKSERFLSLSWQLRCFKKIHKRDCKTIWIDWFSPNFLERHDHFIWWTNWV